jgi:hypothetical protein
MAEEFSMPTAAGQEGEQAAAAAAAAIQDATAGLREMGDSVRSTVREVGSFGRSLGFAVSKVGAIAGGVGKGFIADTMATAVSNQMRVGGDFNRNITLGALQAARELPFGIGNAFADVTDPLSRAVGRTMSVVGPIARFGGQVDPEALQELFTREHEAEKRVHGMGLDVGVVAASDASVAQAIAGTTTGRILDMVGDLFQ